MPKATKPRRKPSTSIKSTAVVEAPKPGAGRPTDYRPEHCARVIEIAKAGPTTLEIIACTLDVHRDTLHEWTKKHPEFSDAIKHVKQHCHANMQRIGLAGMTGKLKGFNASSWIFWMKAQFNWDEAGQVDDDDIEPIFD